jgi:hypothetical protein
MIDAKTDFRFTTKTRMDPETGCIEWTANISGGYGRFSVGGKCLLAHRYLFETINGPIPPKLVVRHRCNNPKCVNPTHLTVGSNQDNADDRDAAGRTYCKLSDRDVTTIVGLLMLRKTQRAIAADYGITQAQVSHIRNGHSRSEAVGRELDKDLAARDLAPADTAHYPEVLSSWGLLGHPAQ